MTTSESGTLLLVEDNDIDARVVERRLAALHVNVRLVRTRNGEEALDFLQRHVIDNGEPAPVAILTDLNMPRVDGFELLTQLANDTALGRSPAYVLSTSKQPTDQQQAAALGARGYLVKPVTPAQLLGVITSSAIESGNPRHE